ncbi:MAG: hypothetical protein NUV52_03500, partial [Candidatus Roizmanbacteria bacterium]|nr:hypothetical protein [Candidatus Roizmanbacteria bacterium]
RLSKEDIANEQEILDKTETLDKKTNHWLQLGATTQQAALLTKHADKAMLVTETIASFAHGTTIDRTLFQKQVISTVINMASIVNTTPQQLYTATIAKLMPKDFDTSTLNIHIDTVLSQQAKAMQDYKAGNKSALNVLLGAVMRETKGQADAGAVRQALIKKLSS